MRYYRLALACGIASIVFGARVTAVGAADRELTVLVAPGLLLIAVGAADIVVTVIRSRNASRRQ